MFFDKVEAKPKTENDIYLESAEWKELLKKAETAENKCYTIIYRDTDGDLKEAWHWLSDLNIEDVKAKYRKQKKEIYRFVPKTMEYGALLASIKGGSKSDK
jgi:hypothetical protein